MMSPIMTAIAMRITKLQRAHTERIGFRAREAMRQAAQAAATAAAERKAILKESRSQKHATGRRSDDADKSSTTQPPALTFARVL